MLFRSAMQEMTAALKTLAQVGQLANASALIGKTVTASVAQSNDPKTGMPRPAEQVKGVVDSVTFGTDGASVHIGNRTIPATDVTEVK